MIQMTESDQSDSGNTTKDARAWESQCQSTRLRSWLDESERRMLATKAGRTWTECARESEKQLVRRQISSIRYIQTLDNVCRNWRRIETW